MRHPKRSAPAARLHARSTVGALAATPELEKLKGAALLVYLRLLASLQPGAGRTISVTNANLHRVPRSAQAMLRVLERSGLVRLHYRGPATTRTIEVL